MNPPSAAKRELASRLLARERHGENSEERAAAAGRVYEKLFLCLAPLVGGTGVRALFVRSIKLATAEFPFLGGVAVEPREAAVSTLVASLQGQQPDAVMHGAAALFGAFLTLLMTYVGERLTAQVLRSAWPDIDETPSKETT
jgi:hypothetical protein